MRFTAWLFLLMSTGVLATSPCTRAFRTTTDIHRENDTAMHYLKRLMTYMKCPLVIVPYELSHQRRFRLIADGELDLVMEASKLPERDSYAWFSLPYREEKTVLITLRSNTQTKSVNHIDDIARQHLMTSAPAGGWFGPDVEREREMWRQQHLLIAYKDPQTGLRDLRLGRAQLMLTTDLVVRDLAQQDIAPLPFVVHKEPVYIMFSKRTVTPEDIQLFNHAIQHLRY